MNLLQRFAHTQSLARISAAGTTTVAAIIVLFAAVFLPALSQRSARIGLHAAVEAADARLQRTQAQIDHAQGEIKSLAAAASAAKATPASLDRRLLEVSSIATELGLFVDAIEPGAAVKQPSGESLTSITASGHGPYARVVGLIHLLHERVPDLTVDSLQLTANADHTCSFRLALNWWDAPLTNTHPQLASGAEDGR